MSSVQTDRRFTEQREIPIRRVMITDPNQLPRDISATPNGTIYCTTPGGTRIVYDRSLLLKLSCSPMTKTPPSNMKFIPGVTAGGIPVESLPKTASSRPVKSPAQRKDDEHEQQFEMDI
ncbi:eukaryotic translation initiation factor 4E-binding protein 1-like [Paramacrobiotus metropolitanus]|uniref:eukaryotic translation initiation factor 4E-binding protein 1-like n=1 Tax=Paramacrobiotus metropolitanus TaxID=2943436 RepID=UPI0024464CE1|nr:eukaryotic translation initiation factor 4E-binding protein 1-like [Paramacrobiotus metropolitanus]